MPRIARKAVVAFAILLVVDVARATPPQPPVPTAEAPAMGGKPQTKPSPPVIGLRPNEFLVSQLVHASVRKSDGRSELGVVKGILLDVDHGRVRSVILTLDAFSGRMVELGISNLVAQGQPNPYFTTGLSASDLAKLPAAADATSTSGIDVEKNILRRDVTLSDGTSAGKLVDLAIAQQSGTIDFALIQPQSNGGLGTANTPHAVVWKKIEGAGTDATRALRLTVDRYGLAQAPLYGLKAEERKGDREIGRQSGATLPPPP